MKLSDYIPDWIMLILSMLILLAAFGAFGMICGCVDFEEGAVVINIEPHVELDEVNGVTLENQQGK